MSLVKSATPQITVVVVAFNCADLVQECLEHLRDYCTVPLRVILVDNASSEPMPMVDGLDVTIIRNEENRGWTAAANQGIAQAGWTHVLLLNSDCNVGPGCVEKLLECLRGESRRAVAAPMTGDGHNGPQSFVRGRKIDFNASEGAKHAAFAGNRFSSPTLAFFCALLHRDAIAEIGPLDERPEFASGLGADDEWCHRAIKAGRSCWVVGDAFAQHYGSSSFKRNGIDRRAMQTVAVKELQRITR